MRPQSRIGLCRISGKHKPTSRYQSRDRADYFPIADDPPPILRNRCKARLSGNRPYPWLLTRACHLGKYLLLPVPNGDEGSPVERCNCEYLRGNAVSDKRPSAVGCRGCTRGLVTLVTALLAGRDEKYKCIFFHPEHPLMVRPRLCLPRQKAERCSFSATSEGGCYEVPKGIEIQV
jgi:hypothetical protein